MKYTETRKLFAYDLRALCIRNNWFTRADCQQYDEFLSRASALANVTTDDLAALAEIVSEYSDTDGAEIEDIMFDLAAACTVHFSRLS